MDINDQNPDKGLPEAQPGMERPERPGKSDTKHRLLLLKVACISIAVLVLAGFAIYGGVRVYQHFYGMKKAEESIPADLNLEEGEYRILYQGQDRGIALVQNKSIYLDLDVVNEGWADGMLFWAKDVDQILYTTQTEQQVFDIGSTDVISYQGKPYINAATAQSMFGTQYYVNQKNYTVMVRQSDGKVGEIQDPCYLLQDPSDQKVYTAHLKRGQTVEIYDSDQEGYYFASTEDCYTGYVKQDLVTVTDSTLSRKKPLQAGQQNLIDGTVSLAFQQFYSDQPSDEDYQHINDCSYYINVIVPTYFTLNSQGGIDSVANADYVAWVKQKGYQVWAMLNNNFDDSLTAAAFESTENRKALCQQLLKYCQDMHLDGINVDIEGQTEDTEPYYIQFLRELSMTLRPQGYILSVDCLVPSEWTSHIQRDVIGELSDYVLVMAYDEHYDGSEAGSTSSQSFTMDAITNMLKYVEKDKLILGIPWYTRVWMGIDNLRSDAVGMDQAQSIVDENGLTETYDSTTGQNYAEGMIGETLYRIWMEDETSLTWRLRLALDSGLAGIGAWSLGFENYEVWTVYENVLMTSGKY